MTSLYHQRLDGPTQIYKIETKKLMLIVKVNLEWYHVLQVDCWYTFYLTQWVLGGSCFDEHVETHVPTLHGNGIVIIDAFRSWDFKGYHATASAIFIAPAAA
jgi:hypothetical protein